MTDAPERVPVDRQAPAAYRAQVRVAQAVRAAADDAGLDRTLVELVNVRVSQLNACAACLETHVREALAAGETTQRLAVLSAWRATEVFTDRERAALAVAELVTTLPDQRTQDLEYAEARRHLSDDELAAVTWVAITINAFNRVSILSGHRVGPRLAGSDP